MKTKILGLFLALSVLSLATSAQRRALRPPELPQGDTCACFGEDADCPFGEAAGCAISCKGLCECKGAKCFLGFPISAKCKCK